jgi:hypothetical protein
VRLPWLTFAAGLAFASPAVADIAVASLVADYGTSCLGGSSPERVVVAGLPRDQTALGAAEADRLRLDVEAMLKAAGAGIAAARDVDRLRGLLEGVNSVSAAETEALLQTANAGDALVFIVEPARREGTVSFRLQAMTPDAACKVTSQQIETAIAESGSGAIDRVLAVALNDFFNAAPETSALGICPVVSDAGYSACAPTLTESIAAAALAEAGSANNTLSGRTVEITRLGPAACAAPSDTPATHARLSTDAAGDTWMDLQVRQGSRTLSAMSRTRVDLSPLGCDPAPRPLLDYVALTVNRDAATLDISAAPFKTGQLLDVRIDLGQPAALYCWIIAPDETAFVLLPLGEMADWAAGTYSYPADFGLQSVVLNQPFENLFHCFAATALLAEDVVDRWRAAATGDGGNPVLLDGLALAALLDEMRAQPGMVEAATRIIVR